MGEKKHTAKDTSKVQLFQPSFNRSIRVEAREERLTSDAGVIVSREVMEKLNTVEWILNRVVDPRHQKLITHPFEELLRTKLLLLCQNWTDQDDADRLRNDPALRLAVSNRKGDAPLRETENENTPDGLASQPTLSRTLTTLAEDNNRAVLRESVGIAGVRGRQGVLPNLPLPGITLDIDGLHLKVYGEQNGSAYNGHYHCTCYNSLVIGSAETGFFYGAKLLPGNEKPSKNAISFVMEKIKWTQKNLTPDVSVRVDAEFPEHEMLCELEENNIGYVARITSYKPLQKMAKPYIDAFKGFKDDEEHVECHELRYQAKNWPKDRRVVLVIVPPKKEELFCDYFFLITNYDKEDWPAKWLLDQYRFRGEYERRLGELKSVLTPQLSSTVRTKKHYRKKELKNRYESRDAFKGNEAILLLNLLSYNIVHTARLMLEEVERQKGGRPKNPGEKRKGVGLKRFRETVLKVAARVTLHANYACVSIASTAAPLWQKLWQQIQRFKLPSNIIEKIKKRRSPKPSAALIATTMSLPSG